MKMAGVEKMAAAWRKYHPGEGLWRKIVAKKIARGSGWRMKYAALR